MAVAFDASSESHTGTTPSTSEASFSWSHVPSGTPAGVVVFVSQQGAGVSDRQTGGVLGVTYGGVDLDELDIWAEDLSGETALTQVFFLGQRSAIPAGTQTVVVNRLNDTNAYYAVAYTVTASRDTWVSNWKALSGDGTVAEQSIDDGSFSGAGSSLRLAMGYSGLNDLTALVAGANSTLDQSLDRANDGWKSVHETTAGTGARSVGLSNGSSEDRAFVHIAVSERPTAQTVEHQQVTRSHTGSSESTSQASFSWTHRGAHRRIGAVLVVAQTRANATNDTSVTYGGVSMTLMSSYTAQDTAGEPATERVYYLPGSLAPTGDQTVVINRTNNANPMIGYCITAMGDSDLELVGPVLLQGDGTMAEQAVSDSGDRGNSYRYAVGYHGYSAPTVAGANSRILKLHDFSLSGGGVLGELLPGSGSRSVGTTSGGSDDQAFTHFALQHIVSGTVTLTNKHDTTSATGTVTDAGVTGTVAVTDKADTTAATGTETITGTSALTDQNDEVASTGTETFTGTSAVTDQNDEVAATGAETFTGTAALTDQNDEVVATGTETISGTSDLTNQPDETSATGTHINENDVLGTVAVTDQNDETASSGTVLNPIAGTAALTDQPDETASTGLVIQDVTGTVAVTNRADRMSATGIGGVEDSGGPKRRAQYDDYTLEMDDEAVLALLLLAPV